MMKLFLLLTSSFLWAVTIVGLLLLGLMFLLTTQSILTQQAVNTMVAMIEIISCFLIASIVVSCITIAYQKGWI